MKPEWNDLIQRHLAGSSTDEEAMALERALKTQPELRTLYLDYVNLDLALEAKAAVMECGLVESAPAATQISHFPWRPVLAAAAAILLFAGTLFWSLARRPYAVVNGNVGLQAAANGGAFRGEWHDLQTGLLELTTARGARVVIEAPARFRFESAQKLRLARGRVAADVPPSARGFTVITPDGQAVDLGTKFGVDVPTHGEPEIHVFQGEVIAQPSGGRKQSLRSGEAYSLQNGSGSARELRSAAFVRPDEVASLHAGFIAGQRARSEAALAKLRADPALIALLDFASDRPAEGTYRMVQGRWPGSRAPEFVSVGDHMNLDAGGERDWPQLTLAAWVRLDRLGAPYQSLLHTDGWSKNHAGQVHWMVTRNAKMRLALWGNTLAAGFEEPDHYPDSRTAVLPEQGRWMHLAVVYDSARHAVRFFLNGRFDNESLQDVAHPARLGPAQIGNWDLHDRKLSGRIDELLLLGRAMSDAEVQALFEAGNPYR
jgi:hypothetical protein